MRVLWAGAGPHSPSVFNTKTATNAAPSHIPYPNAWLCERTQALAEILHQKFSDADVEERHHAYLKPFRILVSLLDKPEIGTVGRATAAGQM